MMEITQVRLPKGILKEIDSLVDKGIYSSKSDVIREAVRQLVLDRQIGSIKKGKNSVKEVRDIRKKLSKTKINLDEINNLGR